MSHLLLEAQTIIFVDGDVHWPYLRGILSGPAEIPPLHHHHQKSSRLQIITQKH
jgi:hypothetical protein